MSTGRARQEGCGCDCGILAGHHQQQDLGNRTTTTTQLMLQL